ncbi:MAG TPA: hypothetical protein DDW81_08880 [Cryomorphaceae bacterium]|nr:hypothetical protein [Owenweeksia sp.]HBF20200.1 hypothetical protein [Cryomorphaceae bacterium]|tara:strand:- start:901 stop:2214 length:1314 start_codon:yes stop_codon:yes gene_type:complete
MLEWLRNRYLQAVNSIAFYPFIISTLFIGLSLIIIISGTRSTDEWLQEVLPIFKESEAETARELLSVLIGGMFTLTVFSFSMVMVVLSQAANNYSPKVLDGLLKDKRPQFILGFYVGGLLFCLPLLLNLTDSREDASISITGVFLALVCAITDLFLFIRFIHYVSSSVKPAEVSRSIYKRTYERWKERDSKSSEREYLNEPFETELSFISETANRSGYYQGVNEKRLLKLCIENNITVKVCPQIGDYVLKNSPLFKISGTWEPDKKLLDRLHEAFLFYNIEDIENNIFYGYRQLTEVAAKALSPGINDIGTARICIDFLIDLLSMFTRKPLHYGVKDEKGEIRIIYRPITLHDLFELCLDEIRLCGRTDKNIMDSLIHGCILLLGQDNESVEMQKEVLGFAQKIRHDLECGKYLEDTSYLLEQYNSKLQPLFSTANL